MPKTAKSTQKAPSAQSGAKSTGPAVSPLAPKSFPKLPPLAGIRLATTAAGIRYQQRTDVLLALLAPGTQVAGVFTKSRTASAPVLWCQDKLKDGVRDVANEASAVAGCRPQEVFMASTGVIGEPLPTSKIIRVLSDLARQTAAGNWRAAADAIMTTDTFPKAATATANIDGVKVTINGIAKGSGMIAPDMATMLSFVFTDANLPASVLQECLSAGIGPSFNAITVDSDTSTSDTLMLFATGKGGKHAAIAKASDKNLTEFRRALDGLLLDLALQVVRDGEGAQKLIRIDVTSAESDGAAKRIALSVANSPLVKTAIAGNDANWGRIVMAVGKSGEAADRDLLKISFGGHVVAEKGMRAVKYNEATATKAVSGREVNIAIDLGLGKGKARVWTCDLTHGYIDINGSYRS